MTDTSAVVQTALTSAAVVTGAQWLGADVRVWIGAVAGVAFFMLHSSDRTVVQRLSLFVPSSIGTAYGAEAVVEWWGWSQKLAPPTAFVLGLVIVILAAKWIRSTEQSSGGFFRKLWQRITGEVNRG